jgi:hypothetical protein
MAQPAALVAMAGANHPNIGIRPTASAAFTIIETIA